MAGTGATGARGLDMEVQYLKGVGPKLAMMLQKLGLKTVQDVLWFFPRRYEDRRNLPQLVMLRPGEAATVRGRLINVSTRSTSRGKVLIKAVLDDGTGQVDLIWFNQPWVGRELQKIKGELIAFGNVKESDRYRLEMQASEWEAIDEDEEASGFARLTPVYPLSEGVQQWVVRKAAQSACEYFLDQVVDPVPPEVRERNKLRPLAWCLRQMHAPDNQTSLDLARDRLVFEEFLYLQLGLQMRRNQVQQELGISFPISAIEGQATGSTLFAESTAATLWQQVHAMLPFTMTGAQLRVVEEIWADMESPHPMNRLLQGDVGSGKTAVAACAILAAVRCGYQAAIMAPTEILAEQHYFGLKNLFEPLGITVSLMVGKQGAQAKKRALDAAKSGVAQVCVGTQALIQEHVAFHKLGLVVIDEQHRFGVVQRLALRQKGATNPDVLVMTATPIPRTLTMTLYGDLDLSVIDELPPGRKPIRTHWKKIEDRPKVYAAVRQLAQEGRQAYIVCPMISESEKMQTQAAEDTFYRLSNGDLKDLRLGLLHGQMKPAEKEVAMSKFRQGETDVLVSTVVIEVGVDVPNATTMLIEDANRFGLSQLHQLRGRVGRGADQSFCVLIAQATNPEADRRLKVMVETSDGFKIAEEDLKIRGPGDIAGTRQSGQLEFKVANLLTDGAVLELAKRAAIVILHDDPQLSAKQNQGMLAKVKEQRSDEALIVVS